LPWKFEAEINFITLYIFITRIQQLCSGKLISNSIRRQLPTYRISKDELHLKYIACPY